jgi:hypothetical protein
MGRRGTGGISEPVDFGTAELAPDPDRLGGWTLLVDGTPSPMSTSMIRGTWSLSTCAASPASSTPPRRPADRSGCRQDTFRGVDVRQAGQRLTSVTLGACPPRQEFSLSAVIIGW